LKQIPYLNRIQNDFKGKPLRILSVIPNTKKDVADFNSPVETSEEGYRLRKTFKLPAMEYDVMPVCEGLRPDSIPIGVFCDTIVKDYLIGGYPTLCIIDQNRVVRYVHIGFAPKEKQQEWLELVERQIQTLLLPMATGESATLPNILFETNSYELTEPSKKELESVVTWLQENQNFKIEIRGYTDDRGTAEHNQVLSENRARSVYQYLQARGIETTRLAYRGLGESNAVAGNETEAGRKLNRRIEIALTGE
jgi:outer membrane protein OmpA-like peptidoglycan-associated protein